MKMFATFLQKPKAITVFDVKNIIPSNGMSIMKDVKAQAMPMATASITSYVPFTAVKDEVTRASTPLKSTYVTLELAKIN